MNEPARARATLQRRDVFLALSLALVATVATFLASGLLDRRLLENETMDVWFEADIPRTFRNLTDRWSANDNAKFHPLYVLVGLPPVHLLRTIAGLDAWVAVRVTYAIVAGLWGASMFAFLRLVGCRRPDALVFALVGLTSAGAMFWFPVPETHTLASITVLFPMLVVAASAHRAVPALVEVAASAASLAITFTNWMAGGLASLILRPVRKAVLISAGALALVVGLWAVQKVVVPQSDFLVGGGVGESHILSPESRGVLHIAEVFFAHTVVMPEISVADRPGAGKWPVMLIQPAHPGTAGMWSVASLVLWGGLFLAGLWALVRLPGRERLRLYLGILLAGQCVLFVLFGNETFLYAPNYLPVLIAVAALAALTPWRMVVVAAATALVVTNSVGNAAQLRRAHRFFDAFAPFRHDFQSARTARPEDPWPSGGGKPVDLAPAGTRKFDTGLAMAGGGFSPGLDQFVAAIWVLDESGRVVATSDDLARDGATPVLRRGADSSVVEVGAATSNYRAVWRPTGVRRFRLDLTIPEGQRVALVVRGVGPMRAPVRRLEWNGERLLVNGRWALEPSSRLVSAYLVSEHTPQWTTLRPPGLSITVTDGWAAGRLEFLHVGAHHVDVYDTDPSGPMDRVLATLPPSADLDITWPRATGVRTGARNPADAGGPAGQASAAVDRLHPR